MNSQDLRSLLENSKNKFNIFEDRNTLINYDLKVLELIELVNDFLSNDQKAKLFELAHFKNLSSSIKVSIIESISDDKIKFNLLENPDVVSEFENYDVVSILESMGETSKVQVLHKQDFIKKHDIQGYRI